MISPRELLCATFIIASLSAAVVHAGAGNLVTKPSNYSVPETINRIEKAIVAKGMQIFARIDHGGEAGKVGLEMKPTLLLIFGNPRGRDRAYGGQAHGRD
jgi:uncharacterized protein (DUF302 family)